MSHTPKNQENISESAQKQLEALRRRIDSLDTILLHALAERMQTVREVGELKHRYDIPPLQPQRWQEVLQHKREIAIELHLNPKLVTDLYERIHNGALSIEESLGEEK